ncbi:MAG: hypothetical protein RL885_03005 [Planctomycetota bacterium]
MPFDLLSLVLLTALYGAPNEPVDDDVMLWRYAGTVRVQDTQKQVSLAVLDGLSPEQEFKLSPGYRVESNGGFEISIGQRATVDVRGSEKVTLTSHDASAVSFDFADGRNIIFKLNGIILTAKFPGDLMLAADSQGESLIQVATIGSNLLVKNIQGSELLVYRGQDPLHRIDAGNRLEIPIQATTVPRSSGASGKPTDDQSEISQPAPREPTVRSEDPEPTPEPAPEAAPIGATFEGAKSILWGTQIVRIPEGVRGTVRGSDMNARLELERDAGAQGVAILKIGSARILMGPGARLVINAKGRVVGVQGQVIGGAGAARLGAAGSSGSGSGNAGYVAPNPYEQSSQFSGGHDG